MSILTIIIVLIAAGLIMWAVNSYIPMSPGIKKLMNIVVIVVIIVWLIKTSGLLKYFEQVKV